MGLTFLSIVTVWQHQTILLKEQADVKVNAEEI